MIIYKTKIDKYSIDLTEYKEYKSLVYILEQLDKFKVIDDEKHIIYQVLNKDLENHIGQFHNKLSLIDNTLLIQIEREINFYKRAKMKEIVPLVGLSDDTKVYLYNYLFWKYGYNEFDTQGILKHGKIKKLLSIKYDLTQEKIIIPVKSKLICPICGGEAQYKIWSFKDSLIQFECANCKHREDNNGDIYEPIPLIKCNCEKCTNIKREVFNNFQKLLNSYIDMVKVDIKQKYNNYIEDNSIVITDEIRKRDYKLYSSELSKDEREFVNAEPRSYEIEDLIKKLSSKKYNRIQGDYEEKLKTNLLNHRVIYKEINKIDNGDSEIAVDLIIKKMGDVSYHFVDGSGGGWLNEKEGNYISRMLLKKLMKGSFEEFFSCITGRKNNMLQIQQEREFLRTGRNATNENVNYTFPNLLYFQIITSNIFPVKLDYKINEYYFKDCSTLGNNEVSKFAINIFKSDAEKSVFASLKVKYKGFIIIPNRRSLMQ